MKFIIRLTIQKITKRIFPNLWRIYSLKSSSFLFMGIFNIFHAFVLFLYPLKTSKNLWFSDVFREYRKIQCQEISQSISALSWWRSLSYRNQSTDLPSNSMDGYYMKGTYVIKELTFFFLQSFKNCRRELNRALVIYF